MQKENSLEYNWKQTQVPDVICSISGQYNANLGVPAHPNNGLLSGPQTIQHIEETPQNPNNSISKSPPHVMSQEIPPALRHPQGSLQVSIANNNGSGQTPVVSDRSGTESEANVNLNTATSIMENSAVSSGTAVATDHNRVAKPRALSGTKRAAQNRSAQKAFRERRDKYVKDLEATAVKVLDLEKTVEQLRQENAELRRYTVALQKRLLVLDPSARIQL